MNEFTKALIQALGGDIDQAGPTIEKRIAEAAAACLGDDLPETVRLRREVSAEKPWQIFTIIESGFDRIMLSSDEVAMLRALLVTWDEEALPPGTMYTVPVVMEDSRVVSEWQPEHDD